MMQSLFNRICASGNVLWRPKDLNSVFLWSCPFDLQSIYNRQDNMAKKYMNKLFGDELVEHCITQRLRRMINENGIMPRDMCPIYIATGDQDTTCRFGSASKFYDILKRNGFKARLHSINGWNHLDFSFKDCMPLGRFMDSCVSGAELMNDELLTEHF